ncbi:hypothetical protein [Kandleria vitulina]|uniref:hypothetical protein n=1 Tax=Kandleria vitulina TaxID=1630 RepID=UPI0004908A6C|nr:hypothetical protein [Kandleria vitulina]
MERTDNRELQEELIRAHIDYSELTDFELNSLIKINDYYNSKKQSVSETLGAISFKGISQAAVLRDLGIGKNMASVHPCLGKFIKRKNSQYIQVMNNFVNRNADNVHELKRENKALKDRDIDMLILSAKLDEMEKENKNLRKEIERLNTIIAYRNLN